MITDDQLAMTCIADEAANQPHEGRVAVGIVILNRKLIPYSSDGTMIGTVLHKWAFSGFWAQMVHGVYKETEFDLNGAETEAQALFDQFSAQPVWADCELAWEDAQAWHAGAAMSFTPGPAFAGLTKRTVLYFNPRICAAPAWAIPANQDAVIFAETFFHDGGVHA